MKKQEDNPHILEYTDWFYEDGMPKYRYVVAYWKNNERPYSFSKETILDLILPHDVTVFSEGIYCYKKEEATKMFDLKTKLIKTELMI